MARSPLECRSCERIQPIQWYRIWDGVRLIKDPKRLTNVIRFIQPWTSIIRESSTLEARRLSHAALSCSQLISKSRYQTIFKKIDFVTTVIEDPGKVTNSCIAERGSQDFSLSVRNTTGECSAPSLLVKSIPLMRITVRSEDPRADL